MTMKACNCNTNGVSTSGLPIGYIKLLPCSGVGECSTLDCLLQVVDNGGGNLGWKVLLNNCGTPKESSEVTCIDRSCFAQVVYGVEHQECVGANGEELWMLMSNEFFEEPPSGLNGCKRGSDLYCMCPMQPGCTYIYNQSSFIVGQIWEMACNNF